MKAEKADRTAQSNSRSGAARPADSFQDPVCGMSVDPQNAAANLRHGDHTYYFCSLRCLERFRASPDKYLSGSAESPPHQGHPQSRPVPPIPVRATYTCPMHPQIVRSEPGSCPICGMALEPTSVTQEEGANPELVLMARRFWLCVVLTFPVLILGMSETVGGPLRRLVPPHRMDWLQLILSTPVVLWGGWPLFERGWSSIVNRSLNMFTLISI